MPFKPYKVERVREGDWSKKFLTLDDCSTVIDESAKIYAPDGTLAAVLLRDGVSQENLKRAWFHLKNFWPSTNNRQTASGISKFRVKKDGSVSKTNIGETVNSGVLGFYDRYPRIPYCRKCSWNQQHPQEFADLFGLFKEVSERFREVWPEKWQIQADFAARTHPDFVMPGTAFTTVTVNKNYRTACHRDPNNLENSISTMLVIHDGKLSGGELVLPEYDLALRFRTGDLVWFENTKMQHGNAPIVRYRDSAQRCSMVFYYRAKMVECGSHLEELERAKNRKLGDPMYARPEEEGAP